MGRRTIGTRKGGQGSAPALPVRFKRPAYLVKYGASHVGALALTPDEVGRLLAQVDNVRDTALLSLAISTGIRREDLVGIALKDVDAEVGNVTFYEKKKRRTRTVPVDGGALRALRHYVGTLPKGAEWLFPSVYRSAKRAEEERTRAPHLTGRVAWNVLEKWCRAAGLEPRPFHSLRSTCYKLAQARGWSTAKAAALIGDSINVANEVYGVATPGEVKEAARDTPILP